MLSYVRALGRLMRGKRDTLPADLPLSVRQALTKVREQRLTYLAKSKLVSLARLALAAEARRDPGIFVEAGCALGGSSILLCAAKADSRPLEVYDVFGQIPPPSAKDGADVHERYQVIASGRSKGIGGDQYYGYRGDLVDTVRLNFAELGYPVEANSVSLVQGLLQDTLQGDAPVALAHVDVDWYEPVMACLERIIPRLTPGGALVLDDYGDWSGCRRAVDEYFAGPRGAEFTFDDAPGHRVVQRRQAV